MNVVKYILALLLALIFSAILFSIEGHFILPKLIHQYSSGSYSCVVGKVTKNNVSQLTSRNDRLTMAAYVLEVEYQYEVDGKLFNGNCFRYNNLTLWADSLGSRAAIANSKWAQTFKETNPIGSMIHVFYNPSAPADSLLTPGINGDDLMVVLGLIPFNIAMLGLWTYSINGLRIIFFKPNAGGVEIQDERWLVRVHLSRLSPCLVAFVVIFCLSFIVLLIVKKNNPEGHPSFEAAISAICVVFSVGILAYFWGLQKKRSGDWDLIVDENKHTVCLPKTFFGKGRVTIAISDISDVKVETVKRPGENGDFYCYAPTLISKKREIGSFRLADWRDKDRAEAFVNWLRKRLNL